MRRRDQPCAANCSIVFCSFTLRIFAIVPTDMPLNGHSAEHYQRLKVGNLESSKRDHFRPDPVPFDRPLTRSRTGFRTVFKMDPCLSHDVGGRKAIENGPISIAFRPPTSWDKQGSILNTVRNPVRERYADLDMRHGLYSFALKINTNLVPTTFVWEGMLRYHAIGGDFLFFTGNDVGGAPGIWQYDIKSKTVRSLVSGLQRTLKHSKIVPSLNRAGTNSSGKEIGYHLWEPTHVSPGKKYPLILGQSLYVWNSSPQVAANAGYYFATANFTNWINEIYKVGICEIIACIGRYLRG